jgi:pyruvate kinase
VSDIEYVRQILTDSNASHIQIIAKIDSEEGLSNFDDILEQADGIMICRADLSIEIPPEKVYVAQKWMIEKSNFVAKPVFITQQLFTSMVKNARPTRGEASDVNSAILSGVDCVCLEEETTTGDYPINSVNMLCKCIIESENTIDFKKEFNDVKLYCPSPEGTAESVALAAVSSIYELGVNLIIVHTSSGKLARLVSRYKPEVPVICCSSNQSVINQTCC